MRRIKVIVAMVIVLSGLLWSNLAAAPQMTALPPLGGAMQVMGATLAGYSISAWARLSDDKGLDTVAAAQQALALLGVEKDTYRLEMKHWPQQQVTLFQAVSGDTHVLVSVQVLPPDKGSSAASPVTYLMINIEQRDCELKTLQEWRGQLQQVEQVFHTTANISTCLIGYLNGKLKDGEGHTLLQNSFMLLDATIIEQYKDRNTVGYTGFSKQITENLHIGSKSVNVNMEMRYNQQDDRTYVTVASPMITQ